jgi:hypothetical protein
MEAQLRLLSAPEPTEQATRHQSIDDAPALEPGPVAWRLSSSTRELGRRGIEDARAALQSARPGHQHSSAA